MVWLIKFFVGMFMIIEYLNKIIIFFKNLNFVVFMICNNDFVIIFDGDFLWVF